MTKNELFNSFEFNQPMVLRSDAVYYYIYVDDQDQPVGFLTTNIGVEAFAMFAFDSLHRYQDFSPLYLGLFYSFTCVENYFLQHYEKLPIIRTEQGIIKGL
jgi:hypothetical protein